MRRQSPSKKLLPLALAVVGSMVPCAARLDAADVTFQIDPARDVHPISKFIYGINPGHSDTGTTLAQPAYADLHLTLARLGGNRWSAYNWLTNASNAGTDYRLSNDGYLSDSKTPGEAVRPALEEATRDSSATILTIPMMGYVSADESGPVPPGVLPQNSPHFVCSFPARAADPNPSASHVYQDQFVRWVQANFPIAVTAGGAHPIFFMLDNEPDLWSGTHPEVHPAPITYAELIRESIAYASAIKHILPNTQVFGPASYGWGGYETLQNASDSAADNAAINPATGKPYGDMLSYYLAQMNLARQAAGHRLLDALDVHWYPEATGLSASGKTVRITEPDASPNVALARMNAPRSLWDSGYVESSWIARDALGGKPVHLLPRLAADINNNYPGTRLSISEYDYGGGEDISGGVAEADVLGIFGKFGVYAAAHWPEGNTEPFTLGGMRMFRNFDGKGSAFGDSTVPAANSNPAGTSIYASTDSSRPGRLVLIAINRTMSPITANIELDGEHPKEQSFRAFQLTSASRLTDDRLNALPTNLGSLPVEELSHFPMPAESVSAIEINIGH